MKTYIPRPAEVEKCWWVVDATGLPLGRLASQVASYLRGKHKPQFTPHMDLGDHVVIVNASEVALTGNKRRQRVKTRYTGYPGGGRSVGWDQMMKTRPERVVELAVKGMLPRNRLGRRLARHLKVYAGPNHPHVAQRPRPLGLKFESGPKAADGA